MTTATMVLDQQVSLDKVTQAAFDSVLAPLGLKAVGVRGRTRKELVIRVFDRNLVPTQNFRDTLLAALNEVPEYWHSFDSAAFN